jgi:hypothetical protein
LIHLNQVEQVLREMLKNKVDFAFFFEGLTDSDDMITFKHFKHFDFALDSTFIVLVFICLLELLNGNCELINVDIPNYWVSLLMAFQTIP